MGVEGWGCTPHSFTSRILFEIRLFKSEIGSVIMHSKNTRVSRDPEKGPLGPNSIPGQRWPGNQSNWQIMGSDWPSSVSYFASSWLISGSSLTRNGVWPQWTLFRVTLTRVFLECGNSNGYFWHSIFVVVACQLVRQENEDFFFLLQILYQLTIL